MSRDAIVSHSSRGRLRVKIASLKGDEGALAECKNQFAQCPGIVAVEVSPVTGSMLFLHQTSNDAIAEFARTKELFFLQQGGQIERRSSGNLHQNITETFKGMDEKIKSLTDGEMNMGGLAFAVLLGAGFIQIMSGNAGALPWYGAFWYAFNIFLKSKEPEK